MKKKALKKRPQNYVETPEKHRSEGRVVKKIILATAAVVFAAALASAAGMPKVHYVISKLQAAMHMPFASIKTMTEHAVIYPAYFFLNVAFVFAAALVMLYFLSKRSGGAAIGQPAPPRKTKSNPDKKTVLPAVLWLCAIAGTHAMLVFVYLRDGGLLLQCALFGGELVLFFLLAAYLEKPQGIHPARLIEPSELWALSGLSLALILLYMFNYRSWQYSFIGDEYPFLYVARMVSSGTLNYSLFSDRGVYGFNPQMSSLYQAVFVKIFGNGLFGWKLSSAVVVPASIIPFYIWNKLLFGKKPAVIAVVALGFCHTMIAFSHIGYNNIHAVFPVIAGLCLLEIAIRKNSAKWSFFAAAVIGIGCYSYYFSRLMLLFAPLYWFLHPLKRRFSKANAAMLFGVIAAIASFMFIRPDFIEPLLQRSIIKGSEVASHKERALYALMNFTEAFFAFLHHRRLTHFCMYSLTDMATAAGTAFGLAWAVAAFVRDWRAKFMLTAFVITAFVTGALSPYDYIANTRIQFMAPFAAAFSGVGWARIIALGSYWRVIREFRHAVLYIVLAYIIVMNLWRFYGLLPDKFQFSMQAYIVKIAQTFAKDKPVAVVAGNIIRLNEAADIYGFAERLAFVDGNRFYEILAADGLKGKVLVVPYDQLKLPREVLALSGKKGTIRDFTGTVDLIYSFDFTDENYYRQFKELAMNNWKSIGKPESPFAGKGPIVR